MKKTSTLFAFVLFLQIIASGVAQTQAQTPTWADNIACILYTRCTGCHNSNGIAPFPLMTYLDAANNSSMMQIRVNQRLMPPWPPDENYQTYAHERVLTQEEIDLINDWVNNGTLQGNPGNAPTPPVYSGLAQIASPDLSVIMQTYTVPVTSSDLYRCFVIQNVTSVDKFITAMEVLPGNNNIVHHVLVFADTAQTCINLDLADPDPGYTSFGGIGSNTASLIGAWVPGSQPYYLPNNMGISLKANSHVIMQVHYPAGSSGQTDSTRINMLLTNNLATRNVFIVPILNHSTSMVNGPLFIPADSIKTFYQQQAVPFAATVLSVAPHMHLIGRTYLSFGVTAIGDTIKLIDIPDWNFHYQGAYFFRQPVQIPAGTTLYAEALYDNTVNNPHNPSNPPVDVSLGEATTDEMMLEYFYFLLYQNGDENIVVDTATIVQTYNNCTFALGINNNYPEAGQLSLFPNPANNLTKVYLPGSSAFKITVYDVTGKTIAIYNEKKFYFEMNCRKLTAGSYFLEAVNDNSVLRKQFEVIKD
ncbi:MAG: T9SS type A sorting domain-containing protein [Bacteroidia bacterium]